VTVPLKDAEDDCFAISTTASFSFDATRSKKGFVNFNFSRKGRLCVAIFNQALPDFFEITIDRVANEAPRSKLRGIKRVNNTLIEASFGE
jgi:hypothetical protein